MLKDKMKTYNFWISLVSAVLLVARLIAGKFNVEIDSSLVMDVTTGLCGIFVVLGIISAPQKTVTKFIDRPLENSAPTSHCEERSDIAIPVLSEEATVNSEASAPVGEDGRIATEGVISSLLTAPRIDATEMAVVTQSELDTAGVTQSELGTSGVTLSELDTAGVTQSEEYMGGMIERQGNANESINQMPVISEGIDQMPNPNNGVNQMPVNSEGIDQMPNLAEFSKEQLIEIICANPQFLNAGKNSN